MHQSKIELLDTGSLSIVLLIVGDMNIISELPNWFFQQNPRRKLMIGGVGLLFLLCLCAVLSTTLPGFRPAPTITLTFQGADDLVLITWTPAGSLTPTASETST